MEELQILEDIKTHLEKAMLGTDPAQTKTYLAGYIDCLCEFGIIDSTMRDELYVEYAR